MSSKVCDVPAFVAAGWEPLNHWRVLSAEMKEQTFQTRYPNYNVWTNGRHLLIDSFAAEYPGSRARGELFPKAGQPQ